MAAKAVGAPVAAAGAAAAAVGLDEFALIVPISWVTPTYHFHGEPSEGDVLQAVAKLNQLPIDLQAAMMLKMLYKQPAMACRVRQLQIKIMQNSRQRQYQQQRYHDRRRNLLAAGKNAPMMKAPALALPAPENILALEGVPVAVVPLVLMKAAPPTPPPPKANTVTPGPVTFGPWPQAAAVAKAMRAVMPWSRVSTGSSSSSSSCAAASPSDTTESFE